MASENASLGESFSQSPGARACIARYWRRNVALMAGLLCVWAAASLGCGVLCIGGRAD